MRASILIPTVPERRSLLSRLLWTLEPQLTDEVEVLIYDGWTAFGDKVNEMRQKAQGDFSVIIDDDDIVDMHYVERVLPHLTDAIDYLDYGVLHLSDGKFAEVIYADKVHHKCLIRNSAAKQVRLDNDYTADQQWSRDIAPLIANRKRINEPLYTYEYYSKGTVGTMPGTENLSTQRDVGEYPYNKEKFTWF